MDNIRIEATERTPEVDFAFDDNNYSFRGESYPEDINIFFGPLVEQLEDYFKNLEGTDVTFNFELIYFNSSTAKVLMMLFELLDTVAEQGNQVTVNWIYETSDDNMQELGEEYGEDLEYASFKLVAQDV
ncbi:MAG: DUF1987 domain-containing protein [gamma proteobacterium symbiont of Taylorina sp.]|nr:DUF1987 domain-containing protein [gamma proteobacterium symbiont of Taylorina sp.]